MTAQAIKTADLGQGWFANANVDGSFTVRNPDKGQRIDLTADEAARFCELWEHASGRTSRLTPPHIA